MRGCNFLAWRVVLTPAAFNRRSDLPPNEECGHRQNDAQGQEPQRTNGRARLRELLLGLAFVSLLFVAILLVLFVMLLLVVHDSSRFDGVDAPAPSAIEENPSRLRFGLEKTNQLKANQP